MTELLNMPTFNAFNASVWYENLPLLILIRGSCWLLKASGADIEIDEQKQKGGASGEACVLRHSFCFSAGG